MSFFGPLGILQIEMTNRCNLSCTMCHHSSREYASGPQGSMEPALFDSMLEEVRGFRPFAEACYPFWFGETTQHPEFGRLFANLCKVRQKTDDDPIFRTIYLNTNGQHDPEVTAHIVSCLAECGIESVLNYSLDAASPETYGRIRRGGDYQRALKSVHEALKIRGKSRWPALVVQFTVMPDNFEEVQQFCHYWRKQFKKFNRETTILALDELDHLAVRSIGTDVISLRPLLPTGVQSTDSSHRKLWQNASDGCHALIDGQNIHIPSATSTENSINGAGDFKSLAINRPRFLSFEKNGRDARNSPCPLVFSNAIVRWDGIVIPCCQNRPVLGNAAESGLMGAVYSDHAMRLREASLLLDMGKIEPFCAGCTDRQGEWLDFVDPGSLIEFCLSRPDPEMLLIAAGEMAIRDTVVDNVSRRARLHAGDFLMALGWFEDAANVLSRLPCNIERDERIGFSFYRCQSWKRASEHYSKIPASEMKQSILKTAGHAHLMAGRQDEAIELFSALPTGSDWNWAWETFAEKMAGTGRYDKALDAYLHIPEQGRTAAVWMAIGGLYQRKNRMLDGAHAFIKAASLGDSNAYRNTALEVSAELGLKGMDTDLMAYFADNAASPDRRKAIILEMLDRRTEAFAEWKKLLEAGRLDEEDVIHATKTMLHFEAYDLLLKYSGIFLNKMSAQTPNGLESTLLRDLHLMRATAFENLERWAEAAAEIADIDPERGASNYEKAGMPDMAARLYGEIDNLQSRTGYIRCSMAENNTPRNYEHLLEKVKEVQEELNKSHEMYSDYDIRIQELKNWEAVCLAGLGRWDLCTRVVERNNPDPYLKLLWLKSYVITEIDTKDPMALKCDFSEAAQAIISSPDVALEGALLTLWFYGEGAKHLKYSEEDRLLVDKAVDIVSSKAGTGDIKASLTLARWHMTCNRFDQALSTLAGLEGCDVLKIKAEIAERNGEWQTAASWWRALLSEKPWLPDARIALEFVEDKARNISEPASDMIHHASTSNTNTPDPEYADDEHTDTEEKNMSGLDTKEPDTRKPEKAWHCSTDFEAINRVAADGESLDYSGTGHQQIRELARQDDNGRLSPELFEFIDKIPDMEARAVLLFALMPVRQRCVNNVLAFCQSLAEFDSRTAAQLAMTAADSLKKAELYAQGAFFFRKSGDFEKGIYSAQKGLEITPADPECLQQLKAAQCEAGDSGAADTTDFIMQLTNAELCTPYIGGDKHDRKHH